MLQDKPFAFGLLIGRFQSLHTGHADMISKTLSICDRVGIFIGSSQESGTEKNPFDYEFRKRMLEMVFPVGLEIRPLPDRGLGNNSAWGQYVIGQTGEQFHALPDLLVSGKEARRASWFEGEEGAGIAELLIPKTIAVSATTLRNLLAEGDREHWEQYTPRALHELYQEMREKVLLALPNKKTESM